MIAGDSGDVRRRYRDIREQERRLRQSRDGDRAVACRRRRRATTRSIPPRAPRPISQRSASPVRSPLPARYTTATNAATITNRTLTGVISGDDVTYVGGAATFADRNAGTGKTVTGTGLSLAGTDAGNYTVNTIATTLADITPASLTYVATPVRIAVNTPFPTFGGSVVGFVGGRHAEASATTGTAVFETTAADSSQIGCVCDRRIGVVGELRQLHVHTGSGQRDRVGHYTARRPVAARRAGSKVLPARSLLPCRRKARARDCRKQKDRHCVDRRTHFARNR